MLTNLKNLSKLKNKLKPFLRRKDVIDIVLFGSVVKGKALPRDVDAAIISESDIKPDIEGFHISLLKPLEFLRDPPTLATTLLKEGYSLRTGRSFSENFRFKSKVLFIYNLTSLSNSEKVRMVNNLRGKDGAKGLVEEYGGEWLSNSVFISFLDNEYIFEQFFITNKVKFKKFNILIH